MAVQHSESLSLPEEKNVLTLDEESQIFKFSYKSTQHFTDEITGSECHFHPLLIVYTGIH